MKFKLFLLVYGVFVATMIPALLVVVDWHKTAAAVLLPIFGPLILGLLIWVLAAMFIAADIARRSGEGPSLGDW